MTWSVGKRKEINTAAKPTQKYLLDWARERGEKALKKFSFKMSKKKRHGCSGFRIFQKKSWLKFLRRFRRSFRIMLPDKHFPNFRASRSGDRRILFSSGTSFHGFWSSRIVKEFVGWLFAAEGCANPLKKSRSLGSSSNTKKTLATSVLTHMAARVLFWLLFKNMALCI